jgi:hypothetical protein
MPPENNDEGTIPGTSIPRDIDLGEARQELTDSHWEDINRRIRERSREFELAFRDKVKAREESEDYKMSREDTAIEAAALATAAGHIGAIAGMPPAALLELIQVGYQEGAIAVLSRLLQRGG